MEISEWEENRYWNVAYAIGSGITGVFPTSYECRTVEFSANNGYSDRRDGNNSQRSQNANSPGHYCQNKTERELNSLVKTKLKFNIDLNKIVEIFKGLVLWKKQKKH